MRLQETCLQSPAKPHDVLADFFERNRTFNLDDPFGAELHFNFEAGPRFKERSYVIRNADYLRNVSVRTSTSERSDGVNKAPVPTRTTALAVSALRHALRHTVNSWRKQKLVAGQSAWSNWHCGWSRASTCSGRRRSSRYATVCFAFNGHNNEVGGAARIENFKQFIRFRLTRNDITGYVIAVDQVGEGCPD